MKEYSSMAMQNPETGSRTALPLPETPVKIEKSFSREQKEALKKQGFKIYRLMGQSIEALRDEGRELLLTYHEKPLALEALGSMHSEVAINPKKLFLPGSNNKTLVQQEEMVKKFSQELGKKVPGVKAIIGQVPDYAVIVFAHLAATNKGLFGEKDRFCYTRTMTPMDYFVAVTVGNFTVEHGPYIPRYVLHIDGRRVDVGQKIVGIAPLVVPA